MTESNKNLNPSFVMFWDLIHTPNSLNVQDIEVEFGIEDRK